MIGKGWVVTAALLAAVLGAAALIVFVPNSLGRTFIKEAKAYGYIAYTPEEAIALANDTEFVGYHRLQP